MSFSTQVKKYRLALGLTQEELAKRIGLKNRSSVCNIEKGTQTIPFNDIEKWAKALCVTPYELMGYADESPETDATAELLARVARLPEDKQNIISDLIRSWGF